MSHPVVVDANSIIVRNIFLNAMSDLQADETFTGGIYGSINSLSKIIGGEVWADYIYAFFDGGVPDFRYELLPEYKSGRKERKQQLTEDQKEKAFKQIPITKDFFEALGIVTGKYKKREADDAVAAATFRLIKDGQKPVVVTSDRDLWQLTVAGAQMYDLHSGDVLGKDDVGEKIGVDAAFITLYKALAGDSADSIQGVKGCGPKKAADIITTYLDEKHQNLDTKSQLRVLNGQIETLKKQSAVESRISESREYLNRVIDATDLSNSFSMKAIGKKLGDVKKPDWKEFLRLSKKYKMKSFVSEYDRFYQPFVDAYKRRKIG